MLLNPFGEIMAEYRTLENEFVLAELNKEMLPRSGGHRYKNASRPSLYASIMELNMFIKDRSLGGENLRRQYKNHTNELNIKRGVSFQVISHFGHRGGQVNIPGIYKS